MCLANGRAIIVPSTTVLDSNHRKFEKASLTNTEIQRTQRIKWEFQRTAKWVMKRYSDKSCMEISTLANTPLVRGVSE